MRSRGGAAVRRAALWLCCFLGGATAGTGAFLGAEVEVIRHIRRQVGELGFLERAVGRLTFLWRGPDEKIALALEEIPEVYLDHSATAARWLIGLGAGGVAVALPLVLRLRWRRG
ncbi:MAG TPA: hypothetical protein VFI25_17340 [Planctomycetota bacterium]|jgi:hypothetical protein|nr:hypothetical protein [Planctomycetota bacterium]